MNDGFALIARILHLAERLPTFIIENSRNTNVLLTMLLLAWLRRGVSDRDQMQQRNGDDCYVVVSIVTIG